MIQVRRMFNQFGLFREFLLFKGANSGRVWKFLLTKWFWKTAYSLGNLTSDSVVTDIILTSKV